MELEKIRPDWVEVDLDAIEHNVREIARHTQSEIMAVVKADGYGHGAVPVARTALEAGATWLGIATVEEGVTLRRAGIDAPALIFGYVPPSQAEALVRHDLRAAVYDLDFARALSAVGGHARVHLKVDTGMGRIGVRPDQAVAFAQELTALPGIELEGVFTHFSTADEPECDFAQRQLDAFTEVLEALKAAGIEPKVRHACNSAGILLLPQGHYDLVRAGIVIYGLPPDPDVDWPLELRPALSWRTQVSMVKTVEAEMPISYGRTYQTSGQERIATLPVGYADGFFRSLSNRGHVLIKGRPCPIVGRVCMDQTMVRVPDDVDVRPGDEAILIGVQGNERISANDLARAVGTINYEIVCAISKRVPRLYRRHGTLQNQASFVGQ